MNLNLVTPIGPIGYGYVGRHLLRELTKLGVRVALFPIGEVHLDSDWQGAIRLGMTNAERYDPGAPSVRVSLPRMQAEHVGRGRHAGLVFFELDRFEATEVHHLSQLDLILVASRWAAGVVAAHGIRVPTAVAPLGVDRSIFHEATVGAQPAPGPGPTVFVNIGKWERRKGHDFLLAALCNAFTPRDDVIVKLLCNNYTFSQESNEEWARRFLHSPLGPRIRLIPRLGNQREVAELIAGCDCGVFPSRGEGWNLGLLECMSVGLNVIATNHSAHTEFVNEANCRLVHVDETEPAYDGQWCRGHGNWARLGASQMEQIVHHLREVHRLKREGALAPNVAGIETARAMSWRRTAEAVLGALR